MAQEPVHVLERAGIHLFVIWVKMHCILKHNFKGTETITKLFSKMHGFLCHLRKTALCKQGSIVITMLSTHALSYNTSPHTHTPTPNAHKSQHALTHPHTHTKTTYHTCMHAHTHTHTCTHRLSMLNLLRIMVQQRNLGWHLVTGILGLIFSMSCWTVHWGLWL